MSDIYSTLNPQQQEAVYHTEGPLLILAGKCLCILSSAVWRIESGEQRRRIVLLYRGPGCHH